MAIALECDVCGKKYKLADTLAGKTFTCKECGLALDVPGGKKSRRSEDDDDDEVIARKPPKSSATMRTTGGGGGKRRGGRKSQSNPMPLLAVGGGVLVVVMILAVMFSGGAKQGPSLAPPANVTPPAPQPGPVVTIAPVTPTATTPPGTVTPATPPANAAAGTSNANTTAAATTSTNTSAATATPPTSPRPPSGVDSRPVSNAVFVTESSGWSAKDDPPAEPLPSEWATNWKLPISGGYLSDNVINYPSVPSPFVIVGKPSDSRSNLEIWNLATGKKTGTLKSNLVSGIRAPALSSDGKYLAWSTSNGIAVYDVAAKKALGELPVALGTSKFNTSHVEFAGANRLLAFSTVDDGFRAWSLPDGQMLHATPLGDKFGNVEKLAISPGGKYVVLESHFLERTFEIYDTETGNAVGKIAGKLAKGLYGGDNYAPAFSPDGTLLAIPYENTTNDGKTQIDLWKMADGTLAAQLLIEPGIMQRVKNLRETAGLQWFADGKKLLVHGVCIVDAQTGDVLYQFDKPEPSFPGSRRTLGNNAVADLSGTHQELELKAIVVSDSDLQRSAQIAAAGGLASDVKLPPLTKADLDVAPSSATASGWKVVPSGPPTSARALNDPMSLKSSKGTLRQIFIALADQPRAFFKMSDGEDNSIARQFPDISFRVDSKGRMQTRSRPKPIKAKANWVDVYDLGTKQFVSKIDIPFSGDLVSVSPDGRRILVHPHDSQGRLDVFDVSDGQPIIAFRPYQSLADEKDWVLSAAAMVDAEHVVTVNDGGRLVMWELPACRAVYSIDNVASFLVAPGGQLLAVATESGVDLRNSLTGEAVGFVPLKGNLRGLAFHPQGDRLAVLLNDQGGNYVYSIDLKDGQIGAEIPCPIVGAIAWVSDRYLLVDVEGEDLRLFDLEAKTVAWNYPLKGGLTASNIPDDRLWYAMPKSPRVPALQITAVTLPDDVTAKKLAAEKLAPELLLQPGNKVAIRIRVTPPASRPQLENELTSLIQKAVERSGVTVAPTAPIELHVSAEGKIGKTISLQKLGTMETVTIQETTLDLQLSYKRGSETLWQDKLAASNASGFLMKHISEGESVQAAFDKDLWDRMSRYCNGLELPAYLFATKSAMGLGTTPLGPAGPGKQ